MKCHDVQLMISGFIEDRLTDQELETFLEHIATCQDCYDELEVYYMITVGLMQLDEVHTGTLDLKKNLKNYIETKRQNLYNRKRAYVRLRYAKTISAICIATILLFTLYIFSTNQGSIHTIDDFRIIAINTIQRHWYGTSYETELETEPATEPVDPYERRLNFQRQHPLTPSYFYFPEAQPLDPEHRSILEKDG